MNIPGMSNQATVTGNATMSVNIDPGQTWTTRELHSLATQRNVRLDQITWTDSPQAKAFIVEITSSAGEHTISIPHETLLCCATDESVQLNLRERLSGLIGDLARIERRGSLR